MLMLLARTGADVHRIVGASRNGTHVIFTTARCSRPRTQTTDLDLYDRTRSGTVLRLVRADQQRSHLRSHAHRHQRRWLTGVLRPTSASWPPTRTRSSTSTSGRRAGSRSSPSADQRQWGVPCLGQRGQRDGLADVASPPPSALAKRRHGQPDRRLRARGTTPRPGCGREQAVRHHRPAGPGPGRPGLPRNRGTRSFQPRLGLAGGACTPHLAQRSRPARTRNPAGNEPPPLLDTLAPESRCPARPCRTSSSRRPWSCRGSCDRACTLVATGTLLGARRGKGRTGSARGSQRPRGQGRTEVEGAPQGLLGRAQGAPRRAAEGARRSRSSPSMPPATGAPPRADQGQALARPRQPV